MQSLTPELLEELGEESVFDTLACMPGQVFRQMRDRKTIRVHIKGQGYFVKIHFGVGWREIFKNLISLKKPVIGAKNEWNAIKCLQALGLDTMDPAGFGAYGWIPAHIRSFVITKELTDTESLEDLFLNESVSFGLRRRLLRRVATMARTLHENGVNHQDLYICHFLLDQGTIDDELPRLYLIDLHRAQIRNTLPNRWRIKDVAALFFSSFDTGIRRHDIFRFMMLYTGKPLRQTLREDALFWHQVTKRACKLYLKMNHSLPDWIVDLNDSF